MSLTNHPCDRYSCPEWNQGQCFGGGCRANPIKETESDNAEKEINDEWFGEEER